MTRLLGAELLKLRRRWASYVVLGVLLVLMTLVYVLIGLTSPRGGGLAANLVIRFPSAYAVINQFIFGLGSLLAVSYAAAIGGADWNWGVLRVIIARGEGRSRYIALKFLGLAIACTIGVLIAYAAGIALTFLGAALAGSSPGDPLAGEGAATLVRSLVFGTFVLLERAAIGFAVAVLLRSQVAGVVVGIVLYIGESILATILVAISFGGSALRGLDTTHDSQWFQFLPFSIGDSVLAAATPASISGDISRMLLEPVALAPAALAVAVYLVGALILAMAATERAEIA
jgi:ABC-type transport system involved in multi-copper enzyme maturation permease subunit